MFPSYARFREGKNLSGGFPLLQGPVMSSIDPQLKLHRKTLQDSNKNIPQWNMLNMDQFEDVHIF